MAATEFHHAMLMEMEKFDSNTQVTTTHEQVHVWGKKNPGQLL